MHSTGDLGGVLGRRGGQGTGGGGGADDGNGVSLGKEVFGTNLDETAPMGGEVTAGPVQVKGQNPLFFLLAQQRRRHFHKIIKINPYPTSPVRVSLQRGYMFLLDEYTKSTKYS